LLAVLFVELVILSQLDQGTCSSRKTVIDGDSASDEFLLQRNLSLL